MAPSLCKMVLAHLAALIVALVVVSVVVSPENRFLPATALQSRVFRRFPLKSATHLDSQSVLASAANQAMEFKLCHALGLRVVDFTSRSGVWK